MNSTLEQTTMRKVYLRLLPLAMVVYFFCYLDRINVSFAALQMNADIGLTAAAYGLSSTAFDLGDRLFEVPSNVILDKLGARIWIARIMITWGLASGATAFATGPTSFLVVRFLLGLAEAGLFPGIVLLFTYWFARPSPWPHRVELHAGAADLGGARRTCFHRDPRDGRCPGYRRVEVDLHHGGDTDGPVGLHRAVPADRQAGPGKLAERGGASLAHHDAGAGASRGGVAGRFSLWQALVNPKILLLSINYLGIVTASLGLLLFVPQIIKSLGATNMGTGYATTLAYTCGAISMLAWGWVSDRMGERRWNLFWACTLATVGLVVAGMTMGTWWSLAGMCIATAGFYGTKGPFWSMPSMLLTGTAAAAGIAWINSIGNVGGAVGPALVGWIKDFTGSYAGGLYGLAIFTAVSALIAAFALHIPRQVPLRRGVVPAE